MSIKKPHFFRIQQFIYFMLLLCSSYLSGITVDKISPISGTSTGNQTITITGSGFTTATGVNFGLQPAISFNVINDTTISAVTPPNIPIVVDVTVTDGANTSPLNQEDRYVFQGNWDVYVPDYGTNAAHVINTTTKAPEPAPNPVNVGNSPNDVGIIGDGRTAYVVNSGSGDLTPIDVVTRITSANIPTNGYFPILLSLTQQSTTGNYIGYTVNLGSNNVSAINLTTGTPGPILIPVGASPVGVAANRFVDPTAIYTANSGDGTITRIQLSDLSTKTISTGSGSSPSFILITPDGTTAYFTDQNFSGAYPQQLNTVRQLLNVNTPNPTLGLTISDPSFDFTGSNLFPEMAISSDGTRLYVTNTGSTTVTAIDISNPSSPNVNCVIAVEGGPNGIAITPDGESIYVSNATTNAVTIASGLPSCPPADITDLTVGSFPTDPSITPDQAPLAYFTVFPSPGTAGQNTTFNATLSASPVGSIALYQWDFGDSTVGTGQIVTHQYASAGTYTVTLTVTNTAGTSIASTTSYNGKNLLRRGDVTAIYTLQVTITNPVQTPTNTIVIDTPNPSNIGQNVTFVATITNANTSALITEGSVQFQINGMNFGNPVPVNSNGQASNSSNALTGTQTITANYLGTTHFSGSSGSTTQVVNQDSTTTSLTTDLNPSIYGQNFTFTATVVDHLNPGYSPTGVVQFINNTGPIANIIGTGTLVNGVATFSTTMLANFFDAGTYDFIANYLGDATAAPSVSPNYVQVINPDNTTTSVTSDDNPATYGDTINFTAIVNSTQGTIPTGSVSFYDNGNLLGISILSNGVAHFQTFQDLAAGSHTILAQYNSNNNDYNPSSGSLIQIVNLGNAGITVSTSPNPSVFGQQVDITATLTASGSGMTPTGTVSFTSSDGTPLGSAMIVNGVAKFSTTSLLVGTPTITATYNGDTNYNPNSATTIQTVTQAAPIVAVNSAPNSSVFGTPVTITATVTGPVGVSVQPTGTVTFTYGAGIPLQTVTLSNGVATFMTSILPVGADVILASYNGDVNYTTGSNSTTQVVTPAPTTTIVSSSTNPSAFGNSVTFTATVSAAGSSGTPTGSVIFTIDGVDQPSVPLIGTQATFSTSTLSPSNHTIVAHYSGDINHQNSDSPPLIQIVNKGTPLISIITSPNPSTVGAPVTITATVTGSAAADPSGVVNFTFNGILIGSGTIQPDHTVTIMDSTLPIGSDVIAANYTGDTNYTSASNTTTQVVNKDSSTTSLISSLNPSMFGDSVTFTANVMPTNLGSGIPTGSVTFTIDGNPQAPVALVNGQASLSTSSLAVGTHTVVASYSGDMNHLPSTSNAVIQQVNHITPTVVVSTTPNPSKVNQLVTITALVTGPAGAPVAPTGTVSFTSNGNPIPNGTNIAIMGNTATFTTNSLALGTDLIVGTYHGDVNYTTATGSTTQVVTLQPVPDIVIVSTPNPSIIGDAVTITATLSGELGTPIGSVNFIYQGNSIGSAALVNGVASIMTTTLPLGADLIMGVYSGDSNYGSVTGTTIQNVGQDTTNTTIMSSLNPSGLGDLVTFTATVTAHDPLSGTPTGTVTFFIDGVSQPPVALSGNQASFQTSTLSVGMHLVSAVYSGDPNHLTSVSPNLTQNVSQITPSIQVSTTPNPSIFGTSVTISAMVTSLSGHPQPTGSVTFTYNGNSIGTGTIIGNTASIAYSNLPPGNDTIVGTYSGDSNYSMTSGFTSQKVNLAPTISTVTSSLNPSTFGDSVTFTARVTADPSSGTSGGTGSFVIDGVTQPPVAVVNGLATFSEVTFSPGTHIISFVYLGDTNHAPSNSNNLQQVVLKATPSIQMNTSPNPTFFGDSTTISATVIGPIGAATQPTGTVTFTFMGNSLGTFPLIDGVASFPKTDLPVGSDQIIGSYNGDANFNTVTDSTIHLVNPVPTTTTVSTSLSPSSFGQLVTFTAHVQASLSSGVPTGAGFFTIDGIDQPPTTLVNGMATFPTSTLSVGLHSITFTYLGDPNHQNSTSENINQLVLPITPSIQVVTMPNPSVVGQTVYIEATVTGPIGDMQPTGTVTFTSNGNPLGTYNLNGRVASFTTTTLPFGSDTIVATYNGDSNYKVASNSTVQVVRAPTTTTLTSSINPSTFGDPVTFTATITSPPGTGVPTGTATFTIDGVSQPPVSLVNGQATLLTSTLQGGTHNIQVTYSGDSTHVTSISKVLVQIVNPAATTTSVLSSPNPSELGNNVTLTATVTGQPGASIPTGSVNFYSNGVFVGSANLVSGLATLITPNLPIGLDSINAVYSGDHNYLGSQGMTTQIVINASTTTSIISSKNPSQLGDPVTFTGTVTAAPSSGVPTGTITFVIDGVSQAPIALVNGVAAFTTSTLGAGTHTIVANYSGDAKHHLSTSTILTQVVIQLLPPRDVKGKQVENKFVNQTDIVNIIKWKAPLEGNRPVSYRIYRDCQLTKLLAEVSGENHSSASSSQEKFKFVDHNLKRHEKYLYYIVSVDESGILSTPVRVSIAER